MGFYKFRGLHFYLGDCYKWFGLLFDFITTDFWFWCWKFIFRTQRQFVCMDLFKKTSCNFFYKMLENLKNE